MRGDGKRASGNRSASRQNTSSSNRVGSKSASASRSNHGLGYSSGRSSVYGLDHSSHRNSQNSSGRSSGTNSGVNSSYQRRATSKSERNSATYANRHLNETRSAQGSSYSSYDSHAVQDGSRLYSFASYAWEKFRHVIVILFGIVVILLAMLIVFALNSGKYVNGTQIGEIDVSGMTVDQAASALSDYYKPNLDATSVYIFADEESRDDANLDLQLLEADAQAEQVSFAEAQANKKLWVATAESLGASIPCEEIAKEAKVLSDEKGYFERIGLLSTEVKTQVRLSFDEALLADLTGDINNALGHPVSDYSIEIHDGAVYVNKGSKGKLLDDEEFTNSLTELFLTDDSPKVTYVANLNKVSYDITKKMAKKTKKAIENLIPESVEIQSDSASMEVNKSTLMDWVATEKVETQDGWRLACHFDSSLAASSITASLNKAKDGKFASVRINKDGDDITVSTDSMVDLYDLDSGLARLEDQVFATYNNEGSITSAPENPIIWLTVTSSANEFTLDDAITHGILTTFCSYTTEYANTSSTQNRISNIHLAASKLDKSIAAANGGMWSFNDVAGPADADEGYLEANVVDGNTMTTGVGGGICQVATTVFNSVYEAGLPIKERHNHSLYSSNYPAGRDAAIAYPDMDLKWENDTDSDILVSTSYTDYSLTVSLIGVDPERYVETTTGDWETGESYETTYELDKDLGKNASYIKQSGSDGMKISVTRTTYDADGSVLSTDTFPSSYAATDRVIAYGEGSDMNAIKEQYEQTSESSDDDASEDEEESGD